MGDAYIVGAVRSAIGLGKPGRGALTLTRADVHLANVLNGLVNQANVDPRTIDDVVAGCVTAIGEQGFNIARMAVLEAGWPVEVTGTTVNRMCGSSQQAIHQAAHAIMAGQADVMIGCGIELMSREPMGADGMVGPNVWLPQPPEYKYEFQVRPGTRRGSSR